jgi:hypothetical protein
MSESKTDQTNDQPLDHYERLDMHPYHVGDIKRFIDGEYFLGDQVNKPVLDHLYQNANHLLSKCKNIDSAKYVSERVHTTYWEYRAILDKKTSEMDTQELPRVDSEG